MALHKLAHSSSSIQLFIPFSKLPIGDDGRIHHYILCNVPKFSRCEFECIVIAIDAAEAVAACSSMGDAFVNPRHNH